MEALVVIDVQEGFSPIPRDFTTNVIREVRRAKDLDLPILVVKFYCCGEVTPRVRSALKDYPRTTSVRKWNTDGSSEIRFALSRIGDPATELRVCGLYTGRCVADTVDGLVTSGFVVTIVRDACYDDDNDDHESQIEEWMETGIALC